MMTGLDALGVLVCEGGTSIPEKSVELVASEPFDPDKTTMFVAPSATPPGPGWWLADDGDWYPPETPPASRKPSPGWWMASDGRWYPPGSEQTTTIEPVAPANAYASWQPEPQPHDQPVGEPERKGEHEISGSLASEDPASSSPEINTGSVEPEPAGRRTRAKVVGVLLVLFFIAAIAVTALDLNL